MNNLLRVVGKISIRSTKVTKPRSCRKDAGGQRNVEVSFPDQNVYN